MTFIPARHTLHVRAALAASILASSLAIGAPASAGGYVAPHDVGSHADLLYLSAADAGKVDGLAFEDEDVIAYDIGAEAWSMVFDGSVAGLSSTADVDAIAFRSTSTGSVLDISFQSTTVVPGVGKVASADVVTFVPSSLGAETDGYFEMRIDGSDVGLTQSSENVVALSANGANPVVSTNGQTQTPAPKGTLFSGSADGIELSATSLGDRTTGTFSMHLDGSDLGIRARGIGGTSLESPTGRVFIATLGNFSSAKLSGSGSDVFAFTGQRGWTTKGALASFFVGADHGFKSQIDAVHVEPARSFTSSGISAQQNLIYLSSDRSGSVGGVAYSSEDVVSYDVVADQWSMVFDGSDAGIPSWADVRGLSVRETSDAPLVLDLAFDQGGVVPGLDTDAADVVTFVPTQLGVDTSGSFDMRLDGSDLGLEVVFGEMIDALTVADHRTLLSTTNGAHAPAGDIGNLSPDAGDLFIIEGVYGDDSAGRFDPHFSGSDVGVSQLRAASFRDDTDELLVLTDGVGDRADDEIHRFVGTVGDDTVGTFETYMTSSELGFDISEINALHIGPPSVVTPPANNAPEIVSEANVVVPSGIQWALFDIESVDDRDIELSGLVYSMSGTDGPIGLDVPTGTLVAFEPLDAEDPLDDDGDNVYELTVMVTDRNGLSDSLDMTVTVYDGATPPSNGNPQPSDDGDNDWISAGDDNCPNVSNIDQRDTDGDGVGDACDQAPADGPDGDDDMDGLTNVYEEANGLAKDDDDSDHDGSKDGTEVRIGSDATDPDTDADGIDDGQDNCPLVPNPDQADRDHDQLGDACDDAPDDPDRDGDGLSDGAEANRWATSSTAWDSDGDLLADDAEVLGYGTDPLDPDTDDDGITDKFEIHPQTRPGALEAYRKFSDPLLWDTDGDGLSDGAEWDMSPDSFALSADTDGDGATDGDEFIRGLDWSRADGDWDTLPDGLEITLGTNPRSADSDGDLFPDDAEITAIPPTDPNDAASFPEPPIDRDDDGVHDAVDNCEPQQMPNGFWEGSNPVQSDFDGDGFGTACDPDDAIDINFDDVDHDGLTSADEIALDLPIDGQGDSDGLGDGIEFEFGTDPRSADTDGDGLLDNREWFGENNRQSHTVAYGWRTDSDFDGLNDREERDVYETDPRNRDTDLDGLTDGEEVARGTSPTDRDSDRDGLTDGDEVWIWLTDPLDDDSDDDGASDRREVDNDTDPNDEHDVPADVSVSGHARWADEIGDVWPIRHAPIRIEKDSGDGFELVAETTSDGDGAYEFSIDPASISGFGEAFLIVEARWDGRFIVKATPDASEPHEYSIELPGPFTAATQITPVVDVPVGATADERETNAAFRAHASGVAGYSYIEGTAGHDLPEVQYVIPGEPSGGDVTYYSPSFNTNPARIHLSVEHAALADVALHELGHHIARTFDFANGPGGDHQQCVNDARPLLTELQRQRLAWGEGVATWLGLVIGAEVPALVGGLHSGDTFDLEVPCHDIMADPDTGLTDETSIGNVLWDLSDHTPTETLIFDAVDDRYVAPRLLLDLLVAEQPLTFGDFYTDFLNAADAPGDPYDPDLTTFSCVVDAASIIPAMTGSNMAPLANLHLDDPITLVLLWPSEDFFTRDPQTTLTVHAADDNELLMQIPLVPSQLPIHEGHPSFAFNPSQWSALASTGEDLFSFRLAVEENHVPLITGCPSVYGPFVP